MSGEHKGDKRIVHHEPSSETEPNVERVSRVVAALREPALWLERIGVGIVLFVAQHSPTSSQIL